MRKVILFIIILFLNSVGNKKTDTIMEKYFDFKIIFNQNVKKCTGNYDKAFEKTFKGLMVGEALENHLKRLWEIEYCSGLGYYIFPKLPEKIISKKIIYNKKNLVIIEYKVITKTILSSVEDFRLEGGNNLKYIYKKYHIKSPSFGETYQVLKALPCFDLKIKSVEKITFHLTKKGEDWKIFKIITKLLNSAIESKVL